MKHLSKYALAAAFVAALATPVIVAAQEDMGPPPILVFNREFVKPGKSGPHEKTELAFVAAAKANKAPFHYFALTSMTGIDRALFVSAYPNLAAWETESKSADKNPALGAALDKAFSADGDLLSATDTSVWLHRPDLSLNEANLVGVRYFEIQQIVMKPGKIHEAEEWAKMYVEGFKKIPGANWAAYQQAFGTNQNAFIFITLAKSLSDVDTEFGASNTAFEKAVGPDKMKKMRALEMECADTEMYNLFRISPKISIPIDGMVKGEPDFWKPKAAPAAKPAAAKPAAQ